MTQQKQMPAWRELARIFDHGIDATYPEETGVVAPVPVIGVEHVRGQDTSDNTHNVAVKC